VRKRGFSQRRKGRRGKKISEKVFLGDLGVLSERKKRVVKSGMCAKEVSRRDAKAAEVKR
jgi:hypothetical protein